MTTQARIGPNAIIQMGSALQAAVGASTTRGLFGLAGLAGYLESPPLHMVAESEVIQLHTVLRQALAAPMMERVARQAGAATGEYLLRNRIPGPVQRVLRLMPRRLASRVLLAAIVRNAWTFKGSGRLRVLAGPPPAFILEQCAICRDAHSTEPICGYYAATFERLFQELVDPAAQVIETQCAAVAGSCCRFEVRWS